jgi:hypothetical protein
MRRIVYLTIIGCIVVVKYGLAVPRDGVNSVVLGMMAGGAALFTGGLLGFLFGVPHTHDRPDSSPAVRVSEKRPDDSAVTVSSGSVDYRPSTSLEQIADWLTKMLIGVTLTQAKPIGQALWETAGSVQEGFGGAAGGRAFALAVIIYFSIGGFVFGFLWARLYLVSWYREVDVRQVRALDEKLSRIEQRQLADAKALSMISQQLHRTADEPGHTEQEIREVIREASTPVKAQIFYQAQRVSEDSAAQDYYLKIQSVILILKGLVESDNDERYYSNRAELSYALSRKRPPDIDAAEEAISKAIEIRDRQGLKGWRYYEMRRAMYHILRNPEFQQKRQSEKSAVDRIISDLRAAKTETEKWPRWLDQEATTKEWLDLNNIDFETLTKRADA